MKTILITGSDGFLGSAFADLLYSKNFSIFGLSLNISKNDKFKIIKGDITKLEKIPAGVTDIIHFAAITNIDFCEKNPKKCFDVNVFGTLNMLELAKKNNCSFIFISTSQIFGIPKKNPVNEHTKLQPLTIYATSKVLGENLCKIYSDSYNMNITVLRLFSIYGPNSPDYLVTTKIIQQTLKTHTIKIGNLTPKRDFIYIDDLVACLEFILCKQLKGFQIFNIGSGQTTSIATICKKIIGFSKKHITLEQDTSFIRTNEIPELLCDSSKINNLGWKPKISLQKGLFCTYDWFKHYCMIQ